VPGSPSSTPGPAAVGPSPRSWASAAFYPPSGKLVLFGGGTAYGLSSESSVVNGTPQLFNDTWTWDGQRWQQLHPVNSPPARLAAGLVYDAGHGVLVLFGGQSGNNETWTWDGTNWKQMSPTDTPPPWVFAAAMTYDATRKLVLLYDGGACFCISINQTWSWNGSNWTQVSTTTDPNAGAGNPETIVYDAARAQTVFVGPTGTWALDGTGWTRVGGGGPALGGDYLGPTNFVIADDQAQGVLLELGSSGDTWAWNGKAWTALNPSVAPPPRRGEAFAYDPVRRQMVLFGGSAWDGSPGTWKGLSDTWVWDGQIWKKVA
jgi:hypothetical protein